MKIIKNEGTTIIALRSGRSTKFSKRERKAIVREL